jgi:predicted Zn-dependent protease
MNTWLPLLLVLMAMPQPQTSLQQLLADAGRALAGRDYDRARVCLHRALLQKPNSAQALFMMGDLGMQTEHVDEAVGYFAQGLRIEPNSFPGHYELALAFLRQQKWNEGLRELQIAVRIDPRQPDAIYNLALVLLKTGNPREALTRLRQANALAPGRPDLSYNMARAELNLEQTQEAIQDLLEADRRQPNDHDIHLLLAQAYLQSNQPQEVAVLLQPAASAEDWFLLATAELAMGQVEAAARDSANSLTQRGDDIRYLLLNARIDQQRSRQQSALATLERAARLAPGAPDILYSQAASYYFLGQYDEVRHSLDRGRKPLPSRALFLYAMSYENEGNPNQAVVYLQKAVALEPKNARFRCHLGVALLQKNQKQAARQAFTEAARLDPAFALPHFELGKMLVQEKQLTAAAEELESATRIQPDLAPALYQLSRVYGALSEKQRAADAMTRFLALRTQANAEQEEITSDANREVQSP